MIKIISKKQENILKYLTEYEGLGFNKIQALFRKKDIKVNGKKANSNIIVNLGDLIEIFCKNNYFFNIETIYEDENIIIVNKPKKLEVISQTKNIDLLNLINPNFYAVHRIDFNTEGLVIFAKNLESKNQLDSAFKNSQVQKSYVTICKNYPEKDEITFQDYLIKNDKNVKIYKTNEKNSKIILTQIKCLKKKNGFCLLDVNLLTGRTHQIRVHMAYIDHPIAGDPKYGPRKTIEANGQLLHACTLEFIHPTTKEKMHFEAPLDPTFKSILEDLERDNL